MSSSGTQLHNVFVYGSFQEPDVTSVMLERTPESISATLPGFNRNRLKGRLTENGISRNGNDYTRRSS
ncbi:hypothetical protein N665_0038s0030 [Sinapis alba]|nr:hypothetical protein N665_0038s0030 [Sinapis alba]